MIEAEQTHEFVRKTG